MKADRFFYTKGVDICSPKSMFRFLYNHFKYYTLNYWNGLKSIANKVKVYELGLTKNQEDLALVMLFNQDDEYLLQDALIDRVESFNAEHPDYQAYFNGRSDGYIVLGNKENVCSVIESNLDDYLSGFDSVEEAYNAYKQYLKYNGWCLEDFLQELRYYTDLIREFDTFCDELRQIVVDHTNRFILAHRTQNN